MALGLTSSLQSKKLITPGIVTDNLVLKHKYDAGSVVPVSDGAAYTNGVSDRINFGPLDMPSGAFTIGGWFWFASGQLEERPALIGRGTWAGTTKGFLIRFNNDSSASDTTALHVVMGDATSSGNNQTDVYSTTIVRDQWNHIMVTVDGEASGSKTLKCYLNGALDSTHTSVHYVPGDTATTDFLIHKADNINAGDSEVKGYVCNCALWQTVLTQPQIKSIMNKNYAGLTSSEKTNLVSWWNLDSSIAPNYDGIGTSGTELAEPSAMTGLILDNHDETLTEVSLTNSDFTSGSGTTITDWNNSHGGLWERSGDTIISPNGVSLFRRSDNPLTNDVAHKLIVRAKNTVPGSTARLQVYFGGNNNARYDLTDDFQEYTFQGIQQNDKSFILYNPSGGDSTNVTIDWVKLYKYNGNTGLLV